MKYEVGDEVWADVSALRNKWRRRVWKKGKIIEVHDGWYLIDMGAYKIGPREYELKKELTVKDLKKAEVDIKWKKK